MNFVFTARVWGNSAVRACSVCFGRNGSFTGGKFSLGSGTGTVEVTRSVLTRHGKCIGSFIKKAVSMVYGRAGRRI